MECEKQKKMLLSIVTALFVLTLGLPDAKAATEGKYFETYGFAMLDYIQDFNRVNPAWKDTLRPSKIPTASGEFGQDGEAMLSIKQSRFGVQANMPVEGNDLYTKFEFDLFGVGPDEGKTTIRLRHAYGEWGSWLAGQTHSLFMDIDAFPNVIDYWGPAGMVFLRNPQIRWSPMRGDHTFSIAIEKPSNDIDAGNIRVLAPELGASIQANNRVPDLTALYRMNSGWGHVQASGILRYLGYETLSTPNNNPKDNTMGWGVNLSSSLELLPDDKLILAAVYGEGIASYMNDGGVDLAPDGQIGNLSGEAVPLLGIIAYYDHKWNDQWSSSIGYSQTSVDNMSFQAADAFKKGEYASLNALYSPVKNMMTGAEVLWGRRTDKNDADGTDIRAQISMKYSFSSRDF